MTKQPLIEETNQPLIHNGRKPYRNGASSAAQNRIPKDADRPAAAEQPVSLPSLTLILAYVARHSPPLLPRRRFLAPAHLRKLAGWIGKPAPKLRTIRAHPPLMAHFALLQTAGLIQVHNAVLYLTPQVTEWLHLPADEQLHSLLTALTSNTWRHVLLEHGWRQSLGPDYEAYLQQQLQRRRSSSDHKSARALCRLAWGDNHFMIELEPDSPTWMQFDLLQLGDWKTGCVILADPTSICRAVDNGYGLPLIFWLLETATGAALPLEQKEQLNLWLRKGRAYRLNSSLLLVTAQDHQLNTILRQARFKPYIKEQISPRHATVSADFPVILQKWLRQQGYPLHLSDQSAQDTRPSESGSLDFHWLGLRLLVGMGALMPLPFPPPYAQLEELATRLSDQQRDNLEAKANDLLQQLRDAIRGRDAFLPAIQPPDSALMEAIRQAIARQEPLEISYQSPADYEPRYRRVQPARLEERGALFYLHAYCYRAEADLVFRLDRITECEGVKR
jgi:hypothetical protein